MKSKRLFITFFLFLCGTGCLLARWIEWDPKTKPPVSLIEAHEIALSALKDRHVNFYCTHATLARSYSEGDWEFEFSAVDGSSTSVSVGSDKKVRIRDRGFNSP